MQKIISSRQKTLKKSGPLESAIQKKLLGELNELGIFIKPLVTGNVGFPDLVGVLSCTDKVGNRLGIACYVEVKREDGKASKAQLHWLSKLAAAGAITAICQGEPSATIDSIRLQLQQRGFTRVGQCELGSVV